MPYEYIDLDAQIPRWKKILGLYPRIEQGLGGESGDSETQTEGGADTDGNEGNDPEPDWDFDDTDLDELDVDGEGFDYDEEWPEEGDEIGSEHETDDQDPRPPTPTDPGYELAPAPNYKPELPPVDARTFDSWWDFVQSATDETLVGWVGERASRAIENFGQRKRHHAISDLGLPWAGTDTWEQCVEMATRTGWPEGRKMLEDYLTVVRPKPEPYRSIEMSVAGAFPMVPNYCAGDPECMVIDPGADLRSAKPVIRIDFNNWTHSGVKPEDMMLRGAAVVSLAETLERHGYSTELRIVGNSRANFYQRNIPDFRYSIVYKRAGETLDLDRTAFAIAHPATMRRLAFAILEQHADAEPAYHSGYGMPIYEPNDPTSGQPGGAIFVPPSQGGETKDTARSAVNKAAETILSEILSTEEEGHD